MHLTLRCVSRERNVRTHLVSLNLGDQVSERREAAQPHDSFRLLHSQALDGGCGAGRQHDLLPSQEVLELRIVGGLPAKGGGRVGVLDSPITESRMTDRTVPAQDGVGRRRLTRGCPSA